MITGYLLLGVGPEMHPTALCAPPTMISSVECVLTPGEDETEGTPVPFGYYKREGMEVPTQHSSVEETILDQGI